MQDRDVSNIIKICTKRLRELEKYVVNLYNKYRAEEKSEKQGKQSLHATIGGKNNTFVDSVNTQFLNEEMFISEWLSGLLKEYGKNSKYSNNHECDYIIIKLLKDEKCEEYIRTFLKRQFYNTYNEKTRKKPNQKLWELWFGNKKTYWGLLIAPVLRNGEWTNDVSEICRAKFEYWTVGHALKTGIVDTKTKELKKFKDATDLMSFYKKEIADSLDSTYEKPFLQHYINYVEKSDNAQKIPLLIPEIRKDRGIKHKYRMDFAILNSYTLEYVGIELSPYSTHLRVNNMNEKGTIEFNREIKEKWEREKDKERAYFKEYGISVITYTDKDLKNIEECFNDIKKYLKYEEEKLTIEELLWQIKH